jgi:tetratricopeptide (TPR) repeat protein
VLRGDLAGAEIQLSLIPAESDPNGMVTWARWGVLISQRKLPEALAAVQKFPGEAMMIDASAPVPKALVQAIIHFLQGDKPTAQTEFEQARVISEKYLREAPDNPARHAQHGLILAALGRKQEAIAEGKHAVELLPESQDAFDGPQVTATLAQIYGLTGESDEAFRLIEHLLEVPNGLTISTLKFDPVWDPLREDPRFEALINNYGKR